MHRGIPSGRIGRLARLATLGARAGAGALLGRDGEASAADAAEVLGTLRGLAAKVGQMGSYVDGLVPEKQQGAYEAALSALRAQAPRSRPEAVRAAVEAELGAPIDRLFAAWDDAPIASASIGQVHAATLVDGREVAVKVQHPEVRRAVESDLANAGVLEMFAGALGGRRFDSKGMLDVIKRRFREELDYTLEATRLTAFARMHEGDPTVKIPRWIAERSGASVLTTELVRGKTFDEACAATEAERRAWAETMWRFVFKGTLVFGLFNADPHPGNYVFQEGGKVVFLDYGCVQEIRAERTALARAVHHAAFARDEPAFFAAVSRLIDAKPGPVERMAHDYTRRCFEPIFRSPYRITREYAASLVHGMKEMGLAARKVDDGAFFTMPPEMIFMNRLQFGFYSVLARLDVEVDYASVERSFLV